MANQCAIKQICIDIMVNIFKIDLRGKIKVFISYFQSLLCSAGLKKVKDKSIFLWKTCSFLHDKK